MIDRNLWFDFYPTLSKLHISMYGSTSLLPLRTILKKNKLPENLEKYCREHAGIRYKRLEIPGPYYNDSNWSTNDTKLFIPDHNKWEEFCASLSENFTKTPKNEFVYSCECKSHDIEKQLNKTIMNLHYSYYKIDVPTTLIIFYLFGGTCDCSILRNVAINFGEMFYKIIPETKDTILRYMIKHYYKRCNQEAFEKSKVKSEKIRLTKTRSIDYVSSPVASDDEE